MRMTGRLMRLLSPCLLLAHGVSLLCRAFAVRLEIAIGSWAGMISLPMRTVAVVGWTFGHSRGLLAS